MGEQSKSGQRQARWLGTAAIALIALITTVHFVTDPQHVAFHNVYRRLNYVPIVMGAFAYGLRGGVGFGALAGAAYVPHAFFAAHLDPAPPIDKVLEIVLYVAIGALTGWLVERQRKSRQRLERSLAERDALETQLVRAGKLSALGELTAGLAHEIRNPLASISGSADAIAEHFEEGDPAYPMVAVLLREIRRLDKVVTEFLEFARPTPSTRERVDLHEVVDEVVALSRNQASTAGVDLHVEGSSAFALADRDQAKQVVLNLILNAVDACRDAASPQVRILTTSRTVGERSYTCVEVTDQGAGIPDSLQEKIFDPYFTTRDDGTGLGLSISNRIMDAHEGFLDLDTSSQATRFSACFPEAA